MSRILFMAKSLLDTYVHEQTIICRQLFIGHMVGSGLIKKEGKSEVNNNNNNSNIIFNLLLLLLNFIIVIVLISVLLSFISGILVLAKVEQVGLGGSLNAVFMCNSCILRTVNFQGSALVEGSKRTVVGLALGVAFFISGHGFAKFEKTLKQFLGISCVSKKKYYDIVKLVYPHISAILDEMCEEKKNRMKEKDGAVLGSWKKAVVTSDGVWHTRGHFSKNGSFIIKNYPTGGGGASLVWA